MNSNKQNTILLIVALILIGIGLFKPNLSNIIKPKPVPSPVEVVDITKPTGTLLTKAEDVVKSLSNNSDRRVDGIKLASLYKDLAQLIQLDGADEFVSTTEEIRQANRLSGLMTDLNIKNKYPDLAKAAQSLVVEAIGDDDIALTPELRKSAVDAFRALSWACNEGSK